MSDHVPNPLYPHVDVTRLERERDDLQAALHTMHRLFAERDAYAERLARGLQEALNHLKYPNEYLEQYGKEEEEASALRGCIGMAKQAVLAALAKNPRGCDERMQPIADAVVESHDHGRPGKASSGGRSPAIEPLTGRLAAHAFTNIGGDTCGHCGGAQSEACHAPLPSWLAEGEALLSARGPDVLVAWDQWWKRHGSDALRMALHDYRSGGPYPPSDSTNVSVVMGSCEGLRFATDDAGDAQRYRLLRRLHRDELIHLANSATSEIDFDQRVSAALGIVTSTENLDGGKA